MKKIVLIFLIFTVFLTVLGSCSTKKEADKDTENEEITVEETYEELNTYAQDIYYAVDNYLLEQSNNHDLNIIVSCDINFKYGELDSEYESIKALKKYLLDAGCCAEDCYVNIVINNSSVESVKVSKKSNLNRPYGQFPKPVRGAKLVYTSPDFSLSTIFY